MTKMKKILAVILAVLLVAGLALTIVSCKKPDSGNASEPDAHEGETWTFTIQVTAEGGAPLEGIGVYVYEDQEQTELTWFDKTDANGMISFTAPVKDGYRYAVLSDVPAGYLAEEMYSITGKENLFVLKAAAIEDLNPEDVRYKLGDTIGDFTVVDTNGDEYKLSEMLKSKKAVVLNFWYIECNPCRAEFPYMNEAYAEFAGDIGLIAMNPVNDNEGDIAAFKSELELDFPVAMADPAWADMLQLTAYPTTVVIDRTGVISLMHTGSIDTADTFKQIFQYFTADDYVPGVVESLDELPPYQEDETVGTAEHPYEQGATGTKITLKPGQEFHVDFLKASGLYMNVTGSNFYVIYDGQKTNSSSGYVGMLVESEGTFYPVKVIFGNPTDKEQELSITFGALKGSVGNPYKLSLGEFDMKTGAGNEEGVFGIYTAAEDGTLTVRCLHSSVSKYGFYLYNLRSYAMRNTSDDGITDEDGYTTVSVKVKKGDKVQFSVAVDRNEDNVIVAGSFRFELILEEGDGEEDKKAEPPKTGYSITVTDEEGNPVEGVAVTLKGEFTYEPTETDPEGLEPVEVKVDLNLTTDAEGHVISEQVTGPYTAIIRVPEGYVLEQTEYELTGEEYAVIVQLKKIVNVDYVITVLDADGQPVPGVMLMMGANLGTTDAEGKYTITLEEAEYSVLVVGGIPEGYLTPTDFFQIGLGEAELVITLEKEAEPEPEYIDIFGEFPIVTDVLASGQKAYYNVYNAGGADLVIEDKDAFVIIGEVTYEAVDGVVTAPVPETMGRMPAQIIIGNGGAAAESYTANVVFQVGSQQNPEELKLGEVVTELAAGNSVGYYYVWTAEEDGVLTLTYIGETGVAGETFDVLLTNTTSYACPAMSENEDGKTVSVEVKTGEQVSVVVSACPNENWEYPAITVELNAAFAKLHVHEYTAVVTAPTCVDAGYTTYTCACGESYVGDEIAALGHTEEVIEGKAATCTEPGLTEGKKCSVCGETLVAQTEIAALGHSYKSVVVEPTTEAGGYTEHTCEVCGDSYKDSFTEKLPPEHIHAYSAVVTAPTCTAEGYTTYTCACGESYVDNKVAALGHIEAAVPGKAATCTESGLTEGKKCSVCGEILVAQTEIAALGHTEEVIEGKAATCTESGLTEGKKCSVCGETLVAQTETAALGHNYKSEVIAPTTEAGGYTEHTCQVCGDSYKDSFTEKLPPEHVHSYEASVTAPTCTEKGYTTYTCVCGDSYVADEIAALGHKYEAVVTAPACTEAGYTTYTCSVCKHSYVSDEVAALGHKYEAVVTAPSCTEAGFTTYTCACGDSYVGDEVAATGHTYEKVVTAPTCTEAGFTTYTCACGDTYTDDKVEALGHDYVSEVIAPTTTSEGYTLHTCSRCGDSYKDTYTDKLPAVPDKPTYTVTVTDFQNNPMAGVAVQILENGKAVKVGMTDTSGKLTAELKAGDYTVKLAFTTTGNHYEESTAVLSADAPELTILVTATVPGPGVEDHWMLGDADAVEVGGTYVSIQKNVMTYFLFTPVEEGTYSFTTSDPAAEISYWGGESFPSNQTANTDYKDNKFTLSVNQSYLGQSYVIGITGADDCILIVERKGSAAFDPNEVPYTEYELAEKPKSFTVTEKGELTFVNMAGKTEDYALVKGEDGFYHFGTADGPVAYICLGGKAPYLSLYTMCGGGGAVSGAPFRYTDYSDLDNIVKEDYTAAILAYGDCMDAKHGVYPVTEDLIYIMTMGVEYKGWAKSENPNFLFGDVENFNPELGWMFTMCYFAN